MISTQSPVKKYIKHKSTPQKSIEKQSQQAKSLKQKTKNQKDIIKCKKQRQKPVLKQQIRSLNCHKNQNKKQSSQSQSSQKIQKQTNIKSEQNSTKFKFSLRKLNQNNSIKINSNGFTTCPPSYTQLTAPIFFLFMVSQIAAFSVDYMKLQKRIIIFSIMTVLLIPILYYWYLTTSISPTDQIQLLHLQQIKNPTSCPSFDPRKHKYFCNLCKTCISKKSFHCNKCNRCVQYFDHHCKWLNNCIGAKNYIEFLKLILCSQLFFVFFYVVNCITLIDIKENNYDDRMPAIFWFAIACLAVSIVPFVALSMLLSLHLYLIIVKRSTIQLILQNRNKNKIHPQNIKQTIELNQKDRKYGGLPVESPLATPSLLLNQHMILKQTNQMNDQSLNRFKLNLTKNLRLSKVYFLHNQQTSNNNGISKDQTFQQRKVIFKPTILKKSFNFLNEEKKRVQIQVKKLKEVQQEVQMVSSSPKKQISLQSLQTQQQQVFNQNGKQFIPKLKFSIQNQISNQLINKIQRHKSQRKPQNSVKFQKQKQYLTNRKLTHKLQPLERNKTVSQRKIKLKNIFDNNKSIQKNKKSNKQNRSSSLKQNKNSKGRTNKELVNTISYKQMKPHTNRSSKQKSNQMEREDDQIQKPKTSRAFIISKQNQ